ncbi:MAG: hypothetical protein R3D00_04985 [Bacteroidia bacterium]
MENSVEQIKFLISKSQTKEALTSLFNLIKESGDQNSEITVLTLLAQQNDLEIINTRGVISNNELDTAQRKLNVQVLELLNHYSANGQLDLSLLNIKKKGIANRVTITLASLTIFFIGFYIISWQLYPSDVPIGAFFDVIIISKYAGIICFVSLIITLSVRAITNR